MKIALFLNHDKYKMSQEDTFKVVTLKTSEDKVIGVENDYLTKGDPNQVIQWIISKKIDEIFIYELDIKIKNLLKTIGVNIRRQNDIGDNHILKSFIL